MISDITLEKLRASREVLTDLKTHSENYVKDVERELQTIGDQITDGDVLNELIVIMENDRQRAKNILQYATDGITAIKNLEKIMGKCRHGRDCDFCDVPDCNVWAEMVCGTNVAEA